MPPDAASGLYIHVPFCLSKCPYCDFYSVTNLEAAPAFAAALEDEMRMRKDEGGWGGRMFGSLYLGGGTPTAIGIPLIEGMLDAAGRHFRMLPDAEITIEANPATITAEGLSGLRVLGVNRINIGVQSFDDGALAFLGRRHTAAEAMDAIRLARKAGFDNIGIDLIYGIPGGMPGGGLPKADESRWAKELETALSFAPEHISCYMLTLEPGTPMHDEHRKGRFELPDDDLAGELFLSASRGLSAMGYEHYEISNFALHPGYRSVHNSGYWDNRPYLGLGPAAHSYCDPVRTANIRSVADYIECIEAGGLPVETSETLNAAQQMMEAVYLGLRRAEGISIAAFESRFNVDFASVFKDAAEKFTAEGRMVADEKSCRLTPEGMLFHETIAAALIDRI